MTALPFDAIIFDLDGVITKTAKVHSAAWSEMFNQFLKVHAEKHGLPFKEFTHKDDYLPYVDGKPRYKGVQSFLESRGINLPYGDPSEAPNLNTICGLGNLKNERFNELLKGGMVEIYPSTVELIESLKERDIRVGVASSSKNCRTILEAAKLQDLFETSVDGVVSEELGLKGKPEPDIFSTAADNLSAPYDRTIVVEDAVSGVQAGRKGNFGLVVGVAREDNESELQINGADIVVPDLSEVTVDVIEDWFNHGLKEDNWSIKYHDYTTESESLRESLLTVGNGYFATRGALEEQSANGISYPGTYIAGLYNRLESKIAGKTIINEDFVNCPNWLPITFKIDDGPWVDMNEVAIQHIERRLDFRDGTFHRDVTIKDQNGRITQIVSKRITSMANPHLAGIRYEISPLNYSGRLTVKSTINGEVINSGVERYMALNSKHLISLSAGAEGDIGHVEVSTTQSKIRIALGMKLSVSLNGNPITSDFSHSQSPGVISTQLQIDVRDGASIVVDKLVSIFSSHDWDSKNPIVDARSILANVNSFEDIYLPSAHAWKVIWDKVDIQIEGDRLTQKLLRLNLYHTFVTASSHNARIDAGIPARGLHGEAYRGHIFWDEIFILPFINLSFPEITKSALMYRYRRLNRAREYAREFGYQGAMYPWQSGSTGREETQIIHLNPLSGEWGADNSSLQRHVSLAIAYNIWQYYWVTLDNQFLENYGGEMFLEICRFWASAAKFNQKTGRFDINHVMGPDEFHEKYPDAEKGGLTNNAYTNLLVLWVFERAQDILEAMEDEARKKIIDKIQLSTKELNRWADIQQRLHIPITDSGLLEQFEGFFDLKELDWAHYREEYTDVTRMDRILKNEGKSPDDYQVLKQADALMVFFVLSVEEIERLFEKSGYLWDEECLANSFRYYIDRTSHGSTLSWLTHAYLCHLIGEVSIGWIYFQRALRSDYVDIQGGTTGEGIHMGVMAGSVYNTLRAYAGLKVNDEQIHLSPSLPNHWREITSKVTFRGKMYEFTLTPSLTKIRINTEKKGNTDVYFNGERKTIPENKWVEIA